MKHLTTVLKKTFSDYQKKNINQMSTALAYYSLFAIAPMLLISLNIFNFFLQDFATQRFIFDQIELISNDSIADLLANLVIAIQTTENAGIFTYLFSIGTLLLAASGIFSQLHTSLNTIWEVEIKKKSLVKTATQKLVALLSVVMTGVLLVVFFIFNSVVNILVSQLPLLPFMVHGISVVISLLGLTLLFSATFTFLPDCKVRWRKTLVGSLITAILFVVGNYAINFYISTKGISSAYGAAGSIIIFLVWIYYSSIIFYLGAAFTKNYIKELS